MANILECRGLVKKYGSFIALNGLNFAVPEGRIVGLLGTNGARYILKTISTTSAPTSTGIRA